MRSGLSGSLEQFLGLLAKRGSWFGGGSAAACANALASALLEKLTTATASRAALASMRHESLKLIDQDAQRFAAVIHALRQGNKRLFSERLRKATEIPCQVFVTSQRIQKMCRRQKKLIRRQFHSDLHCVAALAVASAASAKALIETNLGWLKDKSYTQKIRRRCQRAVKSNAG